jgi:hypothetical protein
MQAISATFTATPQLVLRSYRACHPLAFALRWALVSLEVLVGVVLRSWILVALGVLVAVVGSRSVRRGLRPYLDAPRDLTITMTDEEYRVAGLELPTSRTWTTLRTVRRRGDFWVLRISAAAAMAFPAAVLDDDQTAAFVALMGRHGLLRP